MTHLRHDYLVFKTAGDENIPCSAEFVTIELDRLEGKIQALAEMAVNRQDPDFLSSQVDSAADSMRQTEKAVSELQHLTGLSDQLDEPPPILEADLRGVLRQ